MRDGIAGLEVSERGPVVVAELTGEIDASNASELRLALSERLSSSAAALALDLGAVTYLDSSGIQLLFDLGRRLAARRQRLRLVVPQGAPTRRVLDLCAIETVAPLDPDLESSLEALSTTDAGSD